MCRIAGIISTVFPAELAREKVNMMCEALKHGGPDDGGVFFDEQANIVLGHRRLAIIDTSNRGHQPMVDSTKSAWITFNGEIYNYQDLKKQLTGMGMEFRTGTDTEVILAAYLKWGISAFGMLRGMFAFALFDVANGETYLVRDSLGIKPLYYHIGLTGLSFASEVKAFKAAGIVTEADAVWQVRFLAFGNIPEPYTTLNDVYSLEKGHFLAWNNHTQRFRIQPYPCSPLEITPITDSHAARKDINEYLKNAVKRQLISDAPLGVFLSGGMDSSLLSLLANEQSEQLKTISIFFNEKSYDESSYQNAVLQRLKGESFTHLVQRSDFERFFTRILSDMDMPTTDGINTWFISKYAHEDGLKAVISGLGADELFGGYPSFKRIKYLKYLRKIPAAFFTPAKSIGDKYAKLIFLKNHHPLADYLMLRGLFEPDDIARIMDTDTRQVKDILFNENYPPGPGSYDECHAAWFETNLYMQNQLLRDTDVLSMCHGLEVRVPFLDEEFQQMVQRILPQIRFNNVQPKKILMESFGDLLPETVWNRPKMGFTFPLQDWMNNHSLISDENFYKGATAKKMLYKFKKGHLHWSKIFALYQVQHHG